MAGDDVHDEAWWAEQTRQSIDASRRESVNASLSTAVQSNPDAAAKQQSVARFLNVPPSAVAGYPDDARRMSALTQAESLDIIRKSPALSRFLTVQNNAAVAHDDIKPLADIEGGINDVAAASYVSPHHDETLGDEAARFADATFREYAGVGAKLGRAVGMAATAPLATFDYVFGTQSADYGFREFVKPWEDRVALAKPEGEDLASKLGAAIGSALGTIPYAIMTGGGSLVSAGMAEVGLPLTIAQFLRQAAAEGAKAMSVPAFSAGVNTAMDTSAAGKSPELALTAGAAQAIATLAQGAAPVSMTGKAATRVLSGGLLGGLTGEVIGRQGTNLLLPEDMQRERDVTGMATDVLLGGLMGGAMGGRHAEVVRDLRSAAVETAKVVQDAQRAAAAEKAMDDTLRVVTEDSLLAKREGARDQFNQLVQDMAEQAGGDRIYVDAEVFAKVLDEYGVSQEELNTLMPSAAEQLRTELPAGGQIAIPYGDYFSGLAESPFGAALKPHLRIDPNGVTFSEARKAIDAHIEKLRELTPEAQAKVERAQAWDDSVRQVRDAILPEIESTGRYGRDYNARFADLTTAMYSVLANKMGLMPHEVRDQFKFSMSADRPAAAMDRLFQFAGESAKTAAQEGARGVTGVLVLDATPSGGHQFATGQAVTVRAFHGSDSARVAEEGFSAEKLGSNTGAQSAKAGFFFSGSPETASNYVNESGSPLDRMPPGDLAELVQEYVSLQPKAVKSPDGEWWVWRDVTYGKRADMLRDQEREAVDFFLQNPDTLAKWHADITGKSSLPEAPSPTVYVQRLHMDNPLVKDLKGEAYSDAKYVAEIASAKAAGHDGVILLNTMDGGPVDNVFIVFDSRRVEQTLYQPNVSQEGARGEISFDPSRDPIIHLFKSANESTPVHELAHFFLNVYGEVASRADAPEGLRRDMDLFAKWAGHENVDAWNRLDLADQTAGHEKFAQTFEAYLLTGKAPTPELSGLFAKFKAFLMQVYKSIRAQLPLADLKGDIVGVLDRMVAAEDAIASAEAYRGMVKMIDAKPEGWSDEQWAKHVAVQDGATTSAEDSLARRSVRDMQWLSKAKTAKLKELQAQHDAVRSQTRVEARRDVMGTKEYQAWTWLTRKLGAEHRLPKPGKGSGGMLDPTQDSLLHAVAKLGGIKAESAAKDLGIHEDHIKGTRSPVFGKPLWRRKGGDSADIMAERLGELGYLLPDEHGRFDVNDLAEALDRAVRGEELFSVAKDYHERRGSDMVDFDPLGAGRLDLTDLRQLDLPKHVLDKLIERGMTSQTKTGKPGEGWPPELIANRFGFDDAIHMAHELAGVESPKEAVENLTDRYMLERHADLATPEAIARAADAAVYNEHRIRLFAAELKAVDAAVGSERKIAKAAMQVAEEVLGDKRIRDVRPDVYAAAAAREGRKAKEAYRKIRDPETARKMASTKATEEARKAGVSEAEALALGIAAGDKAVTEAKGRAAERGDGSPTELAIKAKRAQILQSAMAKTAIAMREEAKSAVATLKEIARVAATGRLGAAHGDAIKTLLGKYNLHGVSGAEADRQVGLRAWVDHLLASGDPVTVMPALQGLLSKAGARRFKRMIESRSADGGLVYADDAAQLRALADVLDDEPSIPYVNMTVNELRGLLATAENIAAASRRDNELSSVAAQATYEGTRDALRGSAEANGSDKDLARREASTTKDKMISRMQALGHGGIKMSTRAWLADGGKWGGAWMSSIVLPANERATRETSMKMAATEALRKALEPVFAKIPKKEQHLAGIRVDGLPEKMRLTWEERFSVLLNLGNEGNMQRLMDGGIAGSELKSLTPAQVMAIVKTLDADTIRAAQAVWDHFESYRPEIARLERKYSGREPEWTVPRPITIMSADGVEVTLRGGHYPAKYDNLGNIKANHAPDADTSAAAAAAARFAATTQQTFTKTRADTVKGQPIVLGLRPLYSGVEEIIHDLCWREWVKDQNKLLKSQSIKETLYHKFGPEFHQEWRSWVEDIAAGDTTKDALDPLAKLVKGKIGSAGLAFNAMTAALQAFGATQSARVVGPKWFWEGVKDFAVRRGDAVREMKSKSEFMAHRTVTAWRDLLAIKNKVGGETAAESWYERNKYLPMLLVQQAVDTPTWWGAYRRAVAEGHVDYAPDGKLDDSKAVALADQAVKMSQGGGETVDLSRWERNPRAAHQLFTMFYSFQNTQLNVLYGTAKDKGLSKGARAAWILGVAALTPALMGLAKDALTPGDADADEQDAADVIGKGALAGVENALGLVPYLRETTAAARMLVGEPTRDYAGPTGLRPLADLAQVAKQTHQAVTTGEFDTAFRKAMINLIGDITGLPSAQLNRSWTGAEAMDEGKTENPFALFFGYQEPKR